jgi:hypothetical protein
MTNQTQATLRRFNLLKTGKLAAFATAALTSVLLAACGGGGDGLASATDKSSTSSLPDSTAKASTSSSIFYGMNGHVTNGGAYDATPIATQIQQLKDLGVKIYRNDVYNLASAKVVANMAQQMAAAGITVYPVLMLGQGYSNEQDAYNAGYALAQQVAQTYNYQYFEVGNELESKLNGNVDGNIWWQYQNAPFVAARGVLRGMIAGVKSVRPSAKIIVDGTWLHTAFFQMMMDGSQPDGTHGHPLVNWDITAWHWYSDQGDITHACGGSGCTNLLATIQSFGKPIWINEFGVRPNYGSLQSIGQYLSGPLMMQQFQSIASTYNIQSIQAFELYDDSEGAFGMMTSDGHTQKPSYSNYKSYVQSHPM